MPAELTCLPCRVPAAYVLAFSTLPALCVSKETAMPFPQHARVLLRPAAVAIGVFFFILAAGSGDECTQQHCARHHASEALLPALLCGLAALAAGLLRLFLVRRKGR